MSLDLRTILLRVRSFIAAIAPVTPLKTDDELPGLIDAVLADATLFGWLETKVQADADGVLQIETDPPVALQLSLEAQALKWDRLLALLPVLLEIVRVFRG